VRGEPPARGEHSSLDARGTTAPVRRLRLARMASQLSQDQLAEAAGISRQAVAGFEAGRFDPSLKVALRLGRVLGVPVEDLFAGEGGPAPVQARWAEAPGGGAGHRRVSIADVGGHRWAYPLSGETAVASGFRSAAGYVAVDGVTDPGAAPGWISALPLGRLRPTLVVAGCDPALPLLAEPLARQDPPVDLLWWSCSSARALQLVNRGAVHAAGVHLRDPSGSGYNAHGSRQVLGSTGAAVIGFTAWDEGLAIRSEMTGIVANLADVARHGLRLVNREAGAEARAVLERQRRHYGLGQHDLSGWDVELSGHLQVAAAIACGLADAGVTSEPAARAYGLGFVPLATERFDLIVPRALMSLPELRALLGALGSDDLRRQLNAIDGYDSAACGTVLDTF